jgi:hypothetical protein
MGAWLMATTPDVLRNRVRSLVVAAPFSYTEAVSSDDFSLQGSGSSDAVFRCTIAGGTSIGGFGYSEDRTDVLEVEVARHIAADYKATYLTLVGDCNSLLAAIIRDGHQTSGLYTVPDAGRDWAITAPVGASFLTLRLTVPLNYEAQV